MRVSESQPRSTDADTRANEVLADRKAVAFRSRTGLARESMSARRETGDGQLSTHAVGGRQPQSLRAFERRSGEPFLDGLARGFEGVPNRVDCSGCHVRPLCAGRGCVRLRGSSRFGRVARAPELSSKGRRVNHEETDYGRSNLHEKRSFGGPSSRYTCANRLGSRCVLSWV